jgi:hypothetical protein
MRSYYAHLEQVKDVKALKESKPIFRASAIFPAIHRKEIHTRLIFLSYWLLKRQILKMTCLVTLRSQDGRVLHRSMESIDEPKAYRVELEEYLTLSGLDLDQGFVGSLEIEFFSSLPLVYPFPAVTVNYYGPKFSTFVHTAQRIYNDYEDMLSNSQQKVAEAGFNIYIDSHTEPFIGFVNGPVADRQVSLDFQFINVENEVLQHELILGELSPYETYMIYPARELDLKSFLHGGAGTLKVSFDIAWIFPRLVVGNVQHNPANMSITHSYYDCSCTSEKSDYWIIPEEGWHAAALSVPVQMQDDEYTKIYFYPIYTPSDFSLDLQLYDSKGIKLFEKHDILDLHGSVGEYICLSLNDLCEEVDLSEYQDLSAHIIAKTDEHHSIPARIKISLDIGHTAGLPCNICTNLVPYNPDWKTKEKTYHWLPILMDQPSCSVWILNNSLRKNHTDDAQAILSFYRECDTEMIEREVTIPANGFLVIRPEDDAELSKFLNCTIGWVAVNVTNPYVTTYYFSGNPSGTIGGDHGY